MKYFFLVLAIMMCRQVIAQPQLKLYSTINSVGYQVLLPNDYDPDSTALITIHYRTPGNPWLEAFPPSRLVIDSLRQYRGSLFFLNADTKYDVEILLTDSTPIYHAILIDDEITTRKEPDITSTPNIKFVSTNGSGTQYTKAEPGSFKTLLTSGLQCGTTVILLGGTYDIGEMNLVLNTECSEGTPIIIEAAQGEKVIFEGGDTTQYQWIKTQIDPDLYVATIKPELAYNALCMFDSTRLYPYAFLTPNSLTPTYPSLSNLGYDESGFYRRGSTAYIKTKDKKDPNASRIIFSKHFWCLSVDGGNFNNYLYIKGITFRYYNLGKSDFDLFGNPTTSYPSWTLSFTNTNHVVVDSCTFLYTNFPVSFNGGCNNNIVQHCSMIDGTGYWSHGAFKQTRDILYLEPGSYGRYLENAGIFFSPGNGVTISGNIIRNNIIKGIVSGMGLGFGQTYRMEDYDIYGNDISYCYDGIDATSACINTRIWNNRVSYCPVAISLILPTYGPTYIFRNLLDHISERENQNDIFFADCDGSISNKIWGTGLKLNAGGGNQFPGFIYLVNNTFHSSDTLGFNMYLWFSTWKKLYSRNNIFYSEGKSNFFFDGVGNDSLYSFDSKSDNYFNRSSGTLAIIQPVNGINTCDQLTSVVGLDSVLKLRTKSNDISVSGFSFEPNFKSLLKNDFTLSTVSPLIDKGLIIPGINTNFKNSAPDIGAFETDTTTINSAVPSNLQENRGFRLSPNPASKQLKIYLTENIVCQKIAVYDITGKEMISIIHPEGNEIVIDISLMKAGLYVIEVQTNNALFRQKWVKM